MKRTLLLASLLLCLSHISQGHISGITNEWGTSLPVDVTFRVNMQDQEVSANGVHIAGSFQGWNSSSHPMTLEGNNIYIITVTILEGTYQYKFINGDTFSGVETVPQSCGVEDGFGGYNRQLDIQGPGPLEPGTVCFGECVDCISPPALVSVTLRVDMSTYTVSPDGVHVAGNFQGWDPDSTSMMDVGNGIYEVTFEVLESTHIEYKFINGISFNEEETVPDDCGTFDGVEGNNRAADIFTDTTFTPVCFNACEACPVAPTMISVTFAVNMNEQTVDANGVHIAGTFNDWNTTDAEMTDVDMDGVYTYETEIEENTQVFFKYLNGNAWGNEETVPGECALEDGGGGQSRVLYALNQDIILQAVCFGECNDCGFEEPSNMITLRVNMQDETISPNGIHVAGNFQNWDPATTQMTDGDLDGVYEYTFQSDEWANLSYKFINGNTWGENETVPSECGLPDGNGGYNRLLETGSIDVVAGIVCFSSCENCEQVVEPVTVSVTFMVDMNNETVSENGVHIAGNFQGWSASTSEMTDDNADGVYEFTAEVDTNSTALFKFINGNDWPFQETVPADCGADDGFGSFNRTFEIGTEEISYGPVCFSSCIECQPMVPVLITFQVDMTNETVSEDGVYIAGDFNDWDPTATQLSEFAPGMYQAVVVLNSGQTTEYKFLNGMEWTGEETVPAECGVDNGQGGFNRSYTAGSTNETLDAICFSSCAACVVIPMVDITFQLDMGQLTANAAGVHIAGTFNGFSPAATEMILAFDNVFTTTISVPENSVVNFKYLNGDAWTEVELVPFECGIDDGQGGYNRTVTVDESDFTLPQVCFSSCADCTVNIDEQELSLFRVYPNPSDEILNFVFEKALNTNLILYDATGQIVMVEKITSTLHTMNIASLSPGIYSVNVGGFASQNIIVE